jgi:hypothetical protein
VEKGGILGEPVDNEGEPKDIGLDDPLEALLE